MLSLVGKVKALVYVTLSAGMYGTRYGVT